MDVSLSVHLVELAKEVSEQGVDVFELDLALLKAGFTVLLL